jgi:hypothetical protein
MFEVVPPLLELYVIPEEVKFPPTGTKLVPDASLK